MGQKFQAAEIGHLTVGKQSTVPVRLYLPVVSRSSSFAGPGPTFHPLGRFGSKPVDLSGLWAAGVRTHPAAVAQHVRTARALEHLLQKSGFLPPRVVQCPVHSQKIALLS